MLEIKILNFLQLTFTQQTNMTSKDIFYQYKTLESPIELYIKPLNENLKFKGNILNLYEKEDCRKLELFITAKVNYADSVLPAELKNSFEYLDLILLIKSKKSVYRKCIIFEKKGNIFKLNLDLLKKDWRDDVEISAALVLKKDINEKDGYASTIGTQLGWSTSYKIFFDAPEEKSGGESMEFEWASFSGNKLHWLNKHYNKDIYALDLRGEKKMPKVYLNEDMNKHLRSLLEEKSKRLSPKTSSRDLIFQSIASSIFTQLLTDCLIQYKRNLTQEEGADKEVAIENAWESLSSWKRTLLENYSHNIFPDSRKKDALDNLKESIYEDDNKISEILKVILNIAQNTLGESAHETFTKSAELLTRMGKK